MSRIYIKDVSEHIGEEIVVKTWVDVRRDQGKMVFLDLRDMTGKVQAVVLPNHTEALEVAQKVRPEWVLSVTAKVNKRPEKNIKVGVIGGDVELEVLAIEVLNEATTPAFDISTDGYEVGEEVRLEYKYLDQRRSRIQRNIRTRHKVIATIRSYFNDRGFVEVDTPLLTNPTPEGSRSYLVPSRVHQGTFYALPQSPQQYKQLLMAGGVERYFQIAKCMRDEDTRGDRQPEFTQMDLEMSFVEREDVMKINEELLIKIVTELFPEKRIQQVPFPVFTYKEVMEKYNSDKPDIREDKNDPNLLAFCWVIDFPAFEKTGEDNVDGTGEWTFTHNPFTGIQKEFKSDFLAKKNIGSILSTQYDIAMNGYEIGGGGIRLHKAEELKTAFEIMGYDDLRIEKNFGHMLKALASGTPPHGGIAWGLDRLLMILLNEPNIREVIAFPKTGEGRDILMQAPAPMPTKALRELGIEHRKSN
ncbi:MAG: aspartate--tRNA ligase [Candidatus Pacebacteria bacterium]|nr:aspartate--tRNA ligase [Candidatus Paceibacterota bacterium]MBP9867173.1 aspartate--tRNA ligase [Candidatus Paceibacterota bacterium]